MSQEFPTVSLDNAAFGGKSPFQRKELKAEHGNVTCAVEINFRMKFQLHESVILIVQTGCVGNYCCWVHGNNSDVYIAAVWQGSAGSETEVPSAEN